MLCCGYLGKHIALDNLLLLTSLRIVQDHVSTSAIISTESEPVDGGQEGLHSVQVYLPYIFSKMCAKWPGTLGASIVSIPFLHELDMP